MENYIEYPNATRKGFLPAYEGDGLVMERVHVARGTVQPQSSPTITTGRGGGCGVVVMNENYSEEQILNDSEESYTIPAGEQNGVCGLQDGKLRIRYLTPRECLRLMGQRDEDIDKLMAVEPAKTVQYRLAGNSIVVDVLMAIFNGIYNERTFKPKRKTLEDFL